MLNATCQFEDPLYVTCLHWLTTCISIPIYGIAFIVLLFKCPKYFSDFRNYIVLNITFGLLQDFHIGVIWKLSVYLPWGIMCSNGFLAEYAINSFQIFVFLLIFNGFSILRLFLFRMEAATKHMEHIRFKKIICLLKNLYYAGTGVVMIFVVLVYPDFKNQIDYKMDMEQKRGKFPDFMWCDNCFFMRFDSFIFVCYYTLGYLCILWCFVASVLAVIETMRALNSQDVRLSSKTATIQKNFMYSLILTFIVHFTLIIIPLAGHFLVSMVPFNVEYLAPLYMLLLQNHGAASTFTMIITNNLLRNATKKLFLTPASFLTRSEPKMFAMKTKKDTNGNGVAIS